MKVGFTANNLNLAVVRPETPFTLGLSKGERRLLRTGFDVVQHKRDFSTYLPFLGLSN